MCGCEAHRRLVECTCNCDHTGDRMSQWSERAKELEHALRKLAEAARDLHDKPDPHGIHRVRTRACLERAEALIGEEVDES